MSLRRWLLALSVVYLFAAAACIILACNVEAAREASIVATTLLTVPWSVLVSPDLEAIRQGALSPFAATHGAFVGINFVVLIAMIVCLAPRQTASSDSPSWLATALWDDLPEEAPSIRRPSPPFPNDGAANGQTDGRQSVRAEPPAPTPKSLRVRA